MKSVVPHPVLGEAGTESGEPRKDARQGVRALPKIRQKPQTVREDAG